MILIITILVDKRPLSRLLMPFSANCIPTHRVHGVNACGADLANEDAYASWVHGYVDVYAVSRRTIRGVHDCDVHRRVGANAHASLLHECEHGNEIRPTVEQRP